MNRLVNNKNVIWNIIGATANAFNSLFFAIVVTRINGIDEAGIFTYCFATACLLYFIGNYCGRTFQVTDIGKENSDTDYIYNRITTCIIMMLIAIGFVLIKGYDIHKSLIFIILCAFKCIEAFAESLYSIIQKNGQLYKVGKSLFVKAIVALILFIVIDIIMKNLVVACLSILLVNIIFILLYDYKNIKQIKIVKTKYTNKSNIRILKLGFFAFILTFLATYLVNTSRYAIDDLLENDYQTIFGIIIMPATLMSLLAQYIIQPVLTNISNSIKKYNYKNLKNILLNLVFTIIALGIIITLVACVLEVPVLELIYGIELRNYFVSMIIIIIGSICNSLTTILSSVLIAMRKTFGQTIIYSTIAILSTILAYYLVKESEIFGASITYAITMTVLSLIFLIYTIFNMKKYKEICKKYE